MRIIFLTFLLSSCFKVDGDMYEFSQGPGYYSHGIGGMHHGLMGGHQRTNPYEYDRENSAKRGKGIYQQFCQSCHGRTGEGNGPAAVSLPRRPANLKAIAGKYSDHRIFVQIAYGQDNMPTWRSVLKEAQIWDLVNYLQAL